MCVRTLWSWMHSPQHTMWGYSSPSSAQRGYNSPSSAQVASSPPPPPFPPLPPPPPHTALKVSQLHFFSYPPVCSRTPTFFLSIFQLCVAAVVLSFWWKTGYQSFSPQLHTFKFRALSTKKIHGRYKALHLAVFARSYPNNKKVSLPQDLLNPKTVFSGRRGQFTPQDKR